eukprot:1140128-Rhodomonas_salina.1
MSGANLAYAAAMSGTNLAYAATMSGTNLAYAAAMSGTNLAYAATRCNASAQLALAYRRSADLSSYTPTTQCPILSQIPTRSLRMSSTDTVHSASAHLSACPPATPCL